MRQTDSVDPDQKDRKLGMTDQDSVIVRTWSATATLEGAQNYCRYFAHTLLPQLRALSGFAGGYLLSREVDPGTVELTTHTFWQSVAAIHAFAGQDVTASIVEPEARTFLLEFDATAMHRTLWVDART